MRQSWRCFCIMARAEKTHKLVSRAWSLTWRIGGAMLGIGPGIEITGGGGGGICLVCTRCHVSRESPRGHLNVGGSHAPCNEILPVTCRW